MGRKLNLDFDLYAQQEGFVMSDNKAVGFVGGIGSGKTTAGSIRSLLRGVARKHKGGNTLGMVLAPTFPMLRDSTLRTFKKICGESISTYNRSEMRATFVNGNEVLFRSTDNPETLRGPNISWIWIDEAQLVSEDAYLIALGRLREGEGEIWATFTPNGKTHWTYKVFGKSKDLHFKARTQDNIWLPPDYIKSLEESYSGSFAAQELGGEFVDPEGTLFQRGWFRIVRKEHLPQNLNWIRSWDLALSEDESGDTKKGRKPDRSASVAASVDEMGNVYIADGFAWRKEWPQTRWEIINIAKQEKMPLIIESVAFQKSAVQELLREPELMGIEIRAYNPQSGVDTDYYNAEPRSQSEAAFADRNTRRDKDRTKVDRARVWQSRASNRQMFLVEGGWNEDFLDEVCDFRADMTHPHDDWVDAVSIAMKHLKMPLMVESIRRAGRPVPLGFDAAFDGRGILLSENKLLIV